MNIKAVIVDSTPVPSWELEYDSEDDCFHIKGGGPTQYGQVVDAVYDCKKKEIKPFFIIEKDRNGDFVVGEEVAVERFPKVFIEKIASIERGDYEDYYSKYKDIKGNVQLEGADIPEETKIIVLRSYHLSYTFESGRPNVHEVYVKKLVK